MSLPAIRDEYRVPARLGARVTIIADTTRYDGTVIGSDGDRLNVRYDHGGGGYIFPEDLTFHPICTCFPVPPHYWTTHYGAVDPATMFEPNPECREHFPENFPTTEGA